MTPGSCRVSEDLVLAFVAGDLRGREEVNLAQHLCECGGCREQAIEYRRLWEGFSGLEAGQALKWHAFETPFGTTYAAATGSGLAWVSWARPDQEAAVGRMEACFPARPLIRDPEALAKAERQLQQYFAGERSGFELEVDLSVLSDFERSVLEEACCIPFGEVIPYGELARRIRRPRASRAVGNALGHNPVAIVVPCHRVVRSDGSLGGYTGGVEFKRKLLAIEGRLDLLAAHTRRDST